VILDQFPRHPLTFGPSPVHELKRLTQHLAGRGGGATVWAKREDVSSPLAFGGNKVRNLEYLLGAALAEGADCLVTSGRRWSNHCRLTAAAGARAGLAVHTVLTGPPLSSPGPGQRLMELLGATVHVAATSDREEREERVASVAAALRSEGRHPYVIGVGGSGPIGAYGQVEAAREAVDQWLAAGLDPSAIVLPSATGGTQAGMLVGLAGARSPTNVVGIAVARPPEELHAAIAGMLAGLASLTGTVVDPDAIEIDGSWLGPGYGLPTDEADEAARLLARTEGILVDPIYTAKGLAGLVAAVRAGRWDGGMIVFWHAGGAPGIFEPLG
jgi:1-aminocyclopropane-1-carboxylate deaminase/D-cysteine desulfhydrase-like pyridoxal-dependent ACC family enzyme